MHIDCIPPTHCPPTRTRPRSLTVTPRALLALYLSRPLTHTQLPSLLEFNHTDDCMKVEVGMGTKQEVACLRAVTTLGVLRASRLLFLVRPFTYSNG